MRPPEGAATAFRPPTATMTNPSHPIAWPKSPRPPRPTRLWVADITYIQTQRRLALPGRPSSTSTAAKSSAGP